MTRASNEKRMLLRKQCREALAAHIYDRLGLIVTPGMVRLHPRPDDGYAWSVTEENAGLLNSSLSSGTTRFYQTICKELGHSLEAVSPQVLQVSQSSTPPRKVEVDGGKATGSFTAKIYELEAANLQQGVELDRTRTQLNEALKDAHALQAEVSHLRHEMQTTVSQNDYLRDEVERHKTGIAGVIDTLNKLQVQRKKSEFGSKDNEK